MVSVFGKLFLTLLVVYSAYLVNFKCSQLNETPLEHSSEVVLHPLSHHHNQICDGYNAGVNFAEPYLSKVHEFLDEHVHSHPYYKEYEVDSKLQLVKGKYLEIVHPYVIQLWQLIEVAEVHIYDHLVELYAHLKGQYESVVAPKITEIKEKYL
ncbi:hypothetical protein HYPBUDRAFT_157452 [Hyphopichia burtonii NRRL Y-1933]|uniref:Hemerythrin-like domain-containing protein n=1 Tax=Hyphopichia burtonii NRRL Y-1933 TaxID=984485 RepID=A0A1E4RJE0_9ASCO|nr:hypothetical protein HYPBUDRAFT_157452 [Hyphopichia burtonii NRRL Y-1933]ODV67394.1 hypothetical protein HYPBUDRAFT_157452 [Hyphopichia burtonii NRRL Y-1933]